MDEKKQNVPARNMRDMQTSLEGLEHREWWRWSTALIIMLLLTVGVFALSLPGVRRDALTQSQLELAVKGLFALVLLFDVFAVYQQAQISRLRRQLAGQIGMVAALEALKPIPPEEQEGHNERRRAQRYPIDQRLKVTVIRNGIEEVFHGRVIDISEMGVGAVIAGSLERGHPVVVEFPTGTGDQLRLAAVARYSRGFRHGFEFAGPSENELRILRRASTGLKAEAPTFQAGAVGF
jgi:hypothetical protein